MKRKLLVLLSAVFMFVCVAGCSNSVKGTYINIDKDSYTGIDRINAIDVDTADNGGYLLKLGRYGYARNDTLVITALNLEQYELLNSLHLCYETGSPEHYPILNYKDAFTTTKNYSTSNDKWNGTTLKLASSFIFKDSLKESKTYNVPKDRIAFKNGDLIFDGKTYKKTNKDNLEKEIGKLKEQIKSKIGKEFELKSNVGHLSNYPLRAVFTKIIVSKDGKTEMFE